MRNRVEFELSVGRFMAYYTTQRATLSIYTLACSQIGKTAAFFRLYGEPNILVDTVHEVKEVSILVGAVRPHNEGAILLEPEEAFMVCPVERHLL